MVYIFLFFCTLWGSDWEDYVNAADVGELLAAEASLAKEHKLAAACEVESQRGWFPVNCLSLLERQIAQVHKLADQAPLYRRVLFLCQNHSDPSFSRDQIARLLTKQVLPRQCKRQLEEHLKDLQYIEGDPMGMELEKQTGYEKFRGKESQL